MRVSIHFVLSNFGGEAEEAGWVVALVLLKIDAVGVVVVVVDAVDF